MSRPINTKIHPASHSFPPRAPNFHRTAPNTPLAPAALRLLISLLILTFSALILLSILADILTHLAEILTFLIPPTTALLSQVLNFGPIPFLLTALSTLTTLILIDHTLWYTTALATYTIWRHAPVPRGQHLSHADVAKVYAAYAVVYFSLLWVWSGTLGWIGRDGWVMEAVREVLSIEGIVGGGVFLLAMMEEVLD